MQEFDFHRAFADTPGVRPGTIIDAGAHDGRLALDLATLPASRLLAFEPLPSARARLIAEFIARFGAVPSHVEVRPEALGAARGNLALSVPRVRTPDGTELLAEEWASLAKDYSEAAAADPRVLEIIQHQVPVLPLDDLGLADVTAMKIDVEGYEAELIEGARQTIMRCHPVLSVEIEERHRAGSIRAVPSLLRGLGYRGFWEFYGQWCRIEDFNPDTHQRASPSPAEFTASSPYVFTFYFVPEGRVGELARLARLPV